MDLGYNQSCYIIQLIIEETIMNLTKYFLPLGLLACVPVANDDTGN